MATITISVNETSGSNQISRSTSTLIVNGQFIHEESFNGEVLVRIERPITEINIFDPEFYLNSNPDVAAQFVDNTTIDTPLDAFLDDNSVEFAPLTDPLIDPLLHYVEFGAQEGRDPSPLFDSQYYLEQNPDVATALAGGDFSGDPLLHYVESGAQEGRDPNPFFDSDYYLDSNSDVAAAEFNPLEHYVLFGSSEGRDPSPNFDTDFYLNQNPDVAAAGIDPLTHFLSFGQAEGRLAVPV